MKLPYPAEWLLLSEPIQPENPTGIDIRNDAMLSSQYYALKDFRAQARSMERRYQQQIDSINKSLPLWEKVQESVLFFLKTHTKDLELSAWLMESAVRLQQFSGLLQSTQLMLSLLEQFGSNLFPHPDEEGWLTPCAALRALDGQDREGSLIVPIYQCLFPQGEISNETCLQQWNKLTNENKNCLATAVHELILIYEKIDKLLDELAPGVITHHNIIKALKTCEKHIQYCVEQAPKNEASAPKQIFPILKEGEELQVIRESSIHKTRDEIFYELKKAVEYFRQHEPHSPISYLLQRAIHWGSLSFPELLKEWIADYSERQRVQHFIGISAQSIQ